MKRVVVTGIGMINSLGLDKESSFKAIVAGQCGIKSISSFDTTEHSVKIAGEITNIPQQNIGEVCRGTRDSAGGFKWEYVDKDLFNTVTQEIV